MCLTHITKKKVSNVTEQKEINEKKNTIQQKKYQM